MAKKFKVLARKQHIKNLKLAEYATPYPNTVEEEERAIKEEPCKYRNAFHLSSVKPFKPTIPP